MKTRKNTLRRKNKSRIRKRRGAAILPGIHREIEARDKPYYALEMLRTLLPLHIQPTNKQISKLANLITDELLEEYIKIKYHDLNENNIKELFTRRNIPLDGIL
jgi:hypothetical protein